MKVEIGWIANDKKPNSRPERPPSYPKKPMIVNTYRTLCNSVLFNWNLTLASFPSKFAGSLLPIIM